jgi:ribosomal protein S18 acetylase RimI-like enzyme
MGANNADFQGVNITHTGGGLLGSRVAAEHPEHGYIGHMLMHGNGVVRDVAVHPEWRRLGIATAMWDYAKKAGLNPSHNYSEQTDDGKLWAKSVGN